MQTNIPFKKTINVREVILFIVCIILGYFAFFKKDDKLKEIEEKRISLAKIDSLEKENEFYHHLSDSIKSQAEILSKTIDAQKENSQIITKKYDKIRSDINLLSSDSSISYLSKRLSEAGNY